MVWTPLIIFSCSAECLSCSCICSHPNFFFPIRQGKFLGRTDTDADFIIFRNKLQMSKFSGNILIQKCPLDIHMIVTLPKKAGCVINSTGANCEEQELAMKSSILWVAFMMLVVELASFLFPNLFFSAVQLNLQEANYD